MKITDIEELKNMARIIRKGIIEQVYSANSGHPGGSLSIADILTVLYFNELNIDEKNPKWEDRDRMILSKGHCSPALYSCLANRGFFDKEENFVVLIVLFLFLIGIIYFLFSQSVLRGKKRTGKSIFKVFFYGLFLVGIILSTVFSFFPQDLIGEFSDLTLKIFNTPLARTLWFVIPLIFVGIFRRKK